MTDRTAARYPLTQDNISTNSTMLLVPCASIKSLSKNWSNNMYVFIHSLVFSPRGRSQSPVMEPIWLLAHCILGKFLGVVCHCFPPPLDVPTFAATCLCVCSDARDPSSERWNCGRERFRNLLHALNLRHGFTSPLKEGVLRIFSP